jgi:hypothetical protein
MWHALGKLSKNSVSQEERHNQHHHEQNTPELTTNTPKPPKPQTSSSVEFSETQKAFERLLPHENWCYKVTTELSADIKQDSTNFNINYKLKNPEAMVTQESVRNTIHRGTSPESIPCNTKDTKTYPAYKTSHPKVMPHQIQVEDLTWNH